LLQGLVGLRLQVASSVPVFDSHAHLDDPDWSPEAIASQLAALRATAGWQGVLTAGYGPERHAASRALCQSHPEVVRALGLHPWWLAAQTPEARESGWQALVAELDRGDAVALGELGLDRQLKERMALADQRDWLVRGLAEARRRELPIVLHIVGWYGHALDVLRAAGGSWRGVVHRWSGPLELVAPFVDLGLHVSLALEPRAGPEKRAAIARAVPPVRLLIESDWPFGELDYVAAVQATAQLAADVAHWRGEAPALVLERAAAEARQLYGIDR
jgi:TatD DNase family protein